MRRRCRRKPSHETVHEPASEIGADCDEGDPVKQRKAASVFLSIPWFVLNTGNLARTVVGEESHDDSRHENARLA